jgi:hypothetical protein
MKLPKAKPYTKNQRESIAKTIKLLTSIPKPCKPCKHKWNIAGIRFFDCSPETIVLVCLKCLEKKYL